MRTFIASLGLVTVAGVVWLLLLAQRSDAPETGPVPDVGAPPAVVAEPDPPQAVEARTAGPKAEPFREQVRGFLAQAETLDPAELTRRAAALEQTVLEREAAGDLLPAESAYLQLSLLRVSIADEDTRRQRSEALLARYQEASEAGWRAYRENPDPRHAAYRAAEAELVRRARAEGLSDDALRAELKSLREQYYDGAGR